MSISTFERIADELGSCELVRGEVTPLSPAGFFHNRPAMNIAFLLEAWARRTKRGRVLTNETGVVTDDRPGTVRGADVLYISYKRLPRGQEPEGFVRVPPELIVEVVGPRQSWKRVVEKTGEYFRFEVDRVWVVDPKSRRIHVYQPNAEPVIVDVKSSISDPVILPGFRCRVRALFEM